VASPARDIELNFILYYPIDARKTAIEPANSSQFIPALVTLQYQNDDKPMASSPGGASPPTKQDNEQKFFASFFKKEDLFFLALSPRPRGASASA
jgi:hypothetical protein